MPWRTFEERREMLTISIRQTYRKTCISRTDSIAHLLDKDVEGHNVNVKTYRDRQT